jgi:hypothetical protein
MMSNAEVLKSPSNEVEMRIENAVMGRDIEKAIMIVSSTNGTDRLEVENFLIESIKRRISNQVKKNPREALDLLFLLCKRLPAYHKVLRDHFAKEMAHQL